MGRKLYNSAERFKLQYYLSITSTKVITKIQYVPIATK